MLAWKWLNGYYWNDVLHVNDPEISFSRVLARPQYTMRFVKNVLIGPCIGRNDGIGLRGILWASANLVKKVKLDFTELNTVKFLIFEL
jgi:hypothetical protein